MSVCWGAETFWWAEKGRGFRNCVKYLVERVYGGGTAPAAAATASGAARAGGGFRNCFSNPMARLELRSRESETLP